jgi:hypothetical protein
VRRLGKNLLVLILLAGFSSNAFSQQLLLDHGTRSNGLWLFPTSPDETEFRYLPQLARIAKDSDGEPKFSYMQYVTESNSAADPLTGGGVLHMLVEYHTPEDVIRKAETDLRNARSNPDIRIAGPVLYDKGTYFVTSSILSEEGGGFFGRAPVTEGNQIALAFNLDFADAALLAKSFELETPDVSVTFEMTFSGLRDAYDATVSFEWDKVHNSLSASASGTYFVFGGDIKVEVDRLVENKTITFESRGQNASTEALVNRTYEQIIKMMFDPVPPAVVKESKSGGVAKQFTNMIGNLQSSVSEGVIGFSSAFHLRNIERQGSASLNFNHSETVGRPSSIVFNVADIYKVYGNRPGFFQRVVVQDGPKRRDVSVVVDGDMEAEFDSLLNAVEIKFRKQHSDSAISSNQLVLQSVPAAESPPAFAYTWREGDTDDWFEYEYQVTWLFDGGGRLTQDWQTSADSIISLYSPYERIRIPVMYDRDALLTNGIIAVELELGYDFFDEARSESMLIMTSKEQADRDLEITMPLGLKAYQLNINFLDSQGGSSTKVIETKSRVIFVDSYL